MQNWHWISLASSALCLPLRWRGRPCVCVTRPEVSPSLRPAVLPQHPGFMAPRQAESFSKIYGTFEVGSTVILVPIKLAQDIDRIENDPTLTRAQKDALIKQAELGALQSF